MLCFFAGLTERKEIVPLLTLLRQGQKNLKSSFQRGGYFGTVACVYIKVWKRVWRTKCSRWASQIKIICGYLLFTFSWSNKIHIIESLAHFALRWQRGRYFPNPNLCLYARTTLKDFLDLYDLYRFSRSHKSPAQSYFQHKEFSSFALRTGIWLEMQYSPQMHRHHSGTGRPYPLRDHTNGSLRQQKIWRREWLPPPLICWLTFVLCTEQITAYSILTLCEELLYS